MHNLKEQRNALGVSQSRLARSSGVSRFKICMFELGDGDLTENEQAELQRALQAEANRLRMIRIELTFGGLSEKTPGADISDPLPKRGDPQ